MRATKRAIKSAPEKVTLELTPSEAFTISEALGKAEKQRYDAGTGELFGEEEMLYQRERTTRIKAVRKRVTASLASLTRQKSAAVRGTRAK